MSIEGWRREPGNESFFGLDRTATPKKTVNTKDRSPQATCWCAMGILFKPENTEAGGPGALAWRAINELNVALEGQLVHEFNDEASTANEIVALFLATANKLEARGD